MDVVVALRGLADEIPNTRGAEILQRYADRVALGNVPDHIAFCYRLKDMRTLETFYSEDERAVFALAYETITGQRL